MKGLSDIARLLDRPGQEMHVLDLTASATPSSPAAAPEHRRGAGNTGDVIDSQARQAYRSRLIELDREIQEADEFADLERAEQARSERDALVSQLASAYGLGGRARRSGDPAERARSTVTRRIHDALRRIETHHPELGLHLRRSIRTGTFCVYEPDQPIHWTI